MNATERNPFNAGPGEFIPQNMNHCDLCEQDFCDRTYQLFIHYCDECRMATTVCPQCMHRLGFKGPKTVWDSNAYLRFITQYEVALVANRQLTERIQQLEKEQDHELR